MVDQLSVEELKDLINSIDINRASIIILRFHATWCGPCANIDPYCKDAFSHLLSNVIVADIDIDNSLELYMYLKNKKMIKGVPSILAYEPRDDREQKLWYIPDDSVLNSDMVQVKSFFNRCNNKSKLL